MSRDNWKLTDEEYEYIKGEVAHIFTMYDIQCVPVSGFEIATKLKITLVPYSSLNRNQLKTAMETSTDGFYLVNYLKNYIYYNDIHMDYTRINMTILHEIGHCVLDHIGHGKKEEDEANFFAKYAIAPPILIHKIGCQSINDVYCNFDISYEAAFYAFNYYQKWLRKYKLCGILSNYEKDILNQYEKNYH